MTTKTDIAMGWKLLALMYPEEDRGTAAVGAYIEIRERLSAYTHAAWAEWMRYVFRQCRSNPDGSLTIPASVVSRWSRQVATEYADLIPGERNMAHQQASAVLGAIRAWLAENAAEAPQEATS